MKHKVFGRKLGRDINSRKALQKNLVSALFINGFVTTTLAKAKFARPYSEKLITMAKKDRLANVRFIASSMEHKAFKRLIEEIAPGFKSRPGGYTRITQMSIRRGDSAPMAKLELLPFEKVQKAAEVKSAPAKKQPVKSAEPALKTAPKRRTAKKSAPKKVVKK